MRPTSRPSPAPVRRAHRRRARRFAVLLHHARRRDHWLVLRRRLGPSSWRCQPHAGPHPGGDGDV